MSHSQDQRRPMRNFFVKKGLQLRYIFRIVGAVILTSALTVIVLAVLYESKSGTGYFYFMSDNAAQGVVRQTIMGTIGPALVIAEAVSILVGILIGISASRKFAIPVYKIEVWIREMMKGNYTSKISFREKEEFETLRRSCNALSDQLESRFKNIVSKIEEIRQSTADPAVSQKLDELKTELSV